MSTEVEIGRALAAVAGTLNDQRVEHYDTRRVQEIVTESLGGERHLTVDDGGGVHDRNGARVGAIPQDSKWRVDRRSAE